MSERRLFLLLIAGTVAGSLLANIIGMDTLVSTGIFDSEYFLKLYTIKLDSGELMYYVGSHRISEYIFAMLIMFTPVAIPAFMAGIVFLMIVNGFFSSVCIMLHGVQGFLAYILITAPAYIIFYPGVAYFCFKMIKKTNRMRYVLFGLLYCMTAAIIESTAFVCIVDNIKYIMQAGI